MLTTLRTGALALTSVQYKFDANNRLTVKITTNGNHGLFGDGLITLANVLNISVYGSTNELITNYFNKTLSFKAISPDALEFYSEISSGLTQSEVFVTLPNSGLNITATVANDVIVLTAGNYNFSLIDVAVTNFSTSSIKIKYKDIANSGEDGESSFFYKQDNFEATPKEFGINGQVLNFIYPVEVSIYQNNPNVTNIPLVITQV